MSIRHDVRDDDNQARISTMVGGGGRGTAQILAETYEIIIVMCRSVGVSEFKDKVQERALHQRPHVEP